MLGFLLGALTASAVQHLCTDLGGFVGIVDAEQGVVDGRFQGGEYQASGTAEHVKVWDTGLERVVYEGPWSGLAPEPVVPDRIDARLALELLPGAKQRRDGRFRGRGIEAELTVDGLLVGTWNERPFMLASDGRGGVLGGFGATPGRELWQQIPLDDLDDPTGPPWSQHASQSGFQWIVEQNLLAAGHVPECIWGGRSRFRVPHWPEPIELPARDALTYVSANEAVARTANTTVVYRWLPMSEAEAASLAAVVNAQLDHGAVLWSSGTAMVVAATSAEVLEGSGKLEARDDPLPGGEHLLQGVEDLLQRAAPLPSVPLPLRVGFEMVRELDERRREAGLLPIAWDEELAWGSLSHCAYMDWVADELGEYHGHQQKAELLPFVGEWARDRAGGAEVITRQGGGTPGDALGGWLETPFHRAYPMHPRSDTAGACALPGGARVLNSGIDWARKIPTVTVYPSDGMIGVQRTFNGYETPDPLPLKQYPDKTLPVGFTLAVWFSEMPSGISVLSTSVRTSARKRLDHYVVDVDFVAGKKSVLYLIPKQPLPAETEIAWSVTVGLPGGETLEAGSTFVTAGPQGILPAPTGGLERAVFEAIRAENPDLQVHVDLTLMARQYSNGWAVSSWRAASQWSHSCHAREEVEYWVVNSRYPPPTWDVRYVGFASSDDEICIVLGGDPMAPRPGVR